jgi:enamine deaminase RidA (YjgF/YER057c/UK114 family)
MTPQSVTVEARLAALGLTLPPPPKPLASYVPAVQAGDLLFLSGVLPLADGVIPLPGAVGRELTVEEGATAARQALLNGLAVIAASAGSLERVARVVRLNGYVASAPGFYQQPAVLNGASDLLVELFGERGRHTRTAIGVAALPLNAPVELDLIVQLGPPGSRPRR